MSLAAELQAAAAAAASYGAVSAVLAAETASGARAYLVALGEDEARSWLALDGALAPLAEREPVREVAAIVALCELAVELAAGGRVGELRVALGELERLERPEGMAGLDAAAAELEETLGQPPRLASPGYVDRVGAATRRLEQALGELDSPFASALAAESGAVEGFVAEVESRHRLPLR